jgi:hypothetical protein
MRNAFSRGVAPGSPLLKKLLKRIDMRGCLSAYGKHAALSYAAACSVTRSGGRSSPSTWRILVVVARCWRRCALATRRSASGSRPSARGRDSGGELLVHSVGLFQREVN